jgi:beta-1,4-mannosyl-glycoprotein beta-1,4-N-acetylglucosaminyltransferase
VFDVFPYNGELELLKIKLGEMAPWVDRFVLVEAAMTFSGRAKPLYFDADREALAEFLPKIIHVVVERFPEHATAAWAREFHQRDEAVKGLQGVWAPQDLVLLTDADEVIDGRALEGFAGDAAQLRLHTFRYFLNYRLAASGIAQRGNASVWRAALLERFGSSLARSVLAGALGASRIEDAGWHFTTVGDAREVARKLGSYSHEENDRPDSEGHYGALLARLRAGELEPGWEVCAPELLPASVRDNRTRLERLLL